MMFPTPKYLRIMNKVNPMAVSKPLLVCAKIVEAEKRIVRKISKKNNMITPEVFGSVK